MSKTSKNVLGDQQGKIGKVVGHVVNGVQMYSALGRAPRNPRTPKQTAQRAKFAAVIRIAHVLAGPINIGFRQAAAAVPLTSPRNIFIKKNVANMQYNTETGVLTPDYERVVISDGHVQPVSFSSAVFTTPATVAVTFSPEVNADFGAFEQDAVYVVAYCPELLQHSKTIVHRSEGEASLSVPTSWTGKTVFVWGFVKTSVDTPSYVELSGITLKPNDCSRSSYIGTGTIA